MNRDVLIGFLVALLATAFGCFIYIEYFTGYEFNAALEFIQQGYLYGKVLGLGAIANLFVFFMFIKKKQDLKAKGVLIATFLIALIIFLLTVFKGNITL